MEDSFETKPEPDNCLRMLNELVNAVSDAIEHPERYADKHPTIVRKLDISSLLEDKTLRMYTHQVSVLSLDKTFKQIALSFESMDLEEIKKNIASDLNVLSRSGMWFGGTVLPCVTFEKPKLFYSDYDRYEKDVNFRKEVDAKPASYMGSVHIYTEHDFDIAKAVCDTALVCKLECFDF